MGLVGNLSQVDFPAIGSSASKHGDAETPVRHGGLHIPDGHLHSVFHGIRGEAPDPNRADGSAPGSSRHGPGSTAAAFGSEAGIETHDG